jgi:tetratricopeptide (TPR) repeat protein
MKKLIFIIFIGLITSCGLSPSDENKNPNQNTPIDSSAIAFTEINNQIKAQPENASLFYKRSLLHSDIQNYNEANKDLERALSIDSTNALFYEAYADNLLRMAKVVKLKETIERGIRNSKITENLLLKSAELNLYLKNYNDCIKNADEVLRKNTFNPKAYFIKGMCFKESGDTVRAISSFQTAAEQGSEYYDAFFQAGLLLASQYNPLAIQYLNTAVRLNPTAIEAIYALGIFYQNTNNLKKANEAYDLILKINPYYYDAFYNKGFIASEMEGNYQEAVDWYSKAIEANPNDERGHYMRGYSFERMNQPKQAEFNYRKALQIKPDYTLAAKGLSRIID